MLSFKKWPMKYRMILIVAAFIIFFFLFINRAHADENTTDYTIDFVQDSAVDALAAAVAMAGAAEQAATGNLATGLALAALSASEAGKAYLEAKKAWDSYNNNSESYGTNENISPEQSNYDHGRD